jgi:hypothetical protein
MTTDVARVEAQTMAMRAPAKMPLPAYQAMAYHAAKVMNGRDGLMIEDGFKPPASLVHALSAFSLDVSERMTPATDDLRVAFVGKLFSALRSAKGEEVTREIIQQTAKTLEGLPIWSIGVACAKWRETSPYIPAPAELLKLARKAVAEIMAEKITADRVLSARVIYPASPEAKEMAIRSAMVKFEAARSRPEASGGEESHLDATWMP